MSLQQLILTNSSSSESFYTLDVAENPIVHFSIEGPKDFQFKLYYNGNFNTIMKIPNNEFLELSSAIIAIEKIEFFINGLKDKEQIIFNYETKNDNTTILNENTKEIVQYIQGPPGPVGPQGASIKNITMTDSEVNILLDNGKNIIINGTFVGTGIKNIEDNKDGTFTIYLTDNTNYIISTVKGEKGDQGLPGRDAEFGDITGSIVMLLPTENPQISINSNQNDEGKTDIDFIFKIPQGDTGLSAYELAQQEGYEGTIEEWLNSLKGEQGPQGETGAQGPSGDGVFSGTEAQRIEAENQGSKIYLWIDTSENEEV